MTAVMLKQRESKCIMWIKKRGRREEKEEEKDLKVAAALKKRAVLK